MLNLHIIKKNIKTKNLLTEKSTKKGLSMFIYISVILIASVYIKDKNYYPQVLLEKCEHVAREKKTSNFITDDIEIYSDDSDEKIQMKKK